MTVATVLSVLADLRSGTRLWRRTPSITVAIVLTMALGVGLNAAIFCVIDAVLLQRLPYVDADRLVAIDYASSVPGVFARDTPSPALNIWRERSRTMEAFATYTRGPATLLNPDGEQIQLSAAWVSPNFFDLLGGAPPSLGRSFGEQDVAGGLATAAILSHGFWIRAFGGGAVVGSVVKIGGRDYRVIGVTAATFRFPGQSTPEVFIPMRLSNADAGIRFVHVIARLTARTSLRESQQELASIDRDSTNGYPAAMSGSSGPEPRVRLVPLQRHIAGDLRGVLLVAEAVALCVLLLACVNVGNMLLARAAGRQEEMKVRAALGATSGRLLRLLITEHVALTLLGTAVALIALAWALKGMRLILADVVPHAETIQLDGWISFVVIIVGTLAGAACSVLPALALSREAESIRTDTESTSLRFGARRSIVAIQVSLAFMLLVGSLLLARSLWTLTNQPLGFQPTALLTMRLSVLRTGLSDAKRTTFLDDVLEAVRTSPGVGATAAVTALPLAGHVFQFSATVEGEAPPAAAAPLTGVELASPGYFRTIGARIVAGREFDRTDTSSSVQVAIVNETFVRERMSGPQAVGRRIGLGGDPDLTVIGVVADVRNETPRERVTAEIYRPFSQAAPQLGWHTAMIAVRAQTDHAASLAETIRGRIVGSANGRVVAVYDVATMEQRLATSVMAERQRSMLFGFLASLAVGLVSCGLYGLVAFSVARRRHELSVRAAVGAGRGRLVAHVMWDSVVAVSAGIASGLVGAALISQALAGLLFGVTPLDATAFSGSAAIVAAVSAIATIVPALQATRVDPLSLLKP